MIYPRVGDSLQKWRVIPNKLTTSWDVRKVPFGTLMDESAAD